MTGHADLRAEWDALIEQVNTLWAQREERLREIGLRMSRHVEDLDEAYQLAAAKALAVDANRLHAEWMIAEAARKAHPCHVTRAEP